MGLIQLNNILINPEKISYIGKVDTHVRAHIGTVDHYFQVIIDGHPLDIMAETKEEITKIREDLVHKLTIESCLPG